MSGRSSVIQILWLDFRGKISGLFVLFVFLLALLGWQFLQLDPQIKTHEMGLLALQQKVRTQQQERAQQGIPVSVAERLQEQLDQFDEKIPPDDEFSTLLSDLFDWANRAKLKIDRIAFHPEMDGDTGLLRYGLSFYVQGEYRQIKYFIYLLEQASRILVIDRLGLVAEKDHLTNDNVNLRIELSAYFREQV